MIVRDARKEELDALCGSLCGQPLLQRYEVEPEGLSRDLAAAIDRRDIVLVAADPNPLGLAWVLPRGTFGSGSYLRLIALTPGAESRGVGAALLREAEARAAKNSRHFFLLVSDWNTRAHRFYERLGYSRIGVLPRYVRSDTDELIYYKRL